MSLTLINVGTEPNDGTGDPPRTAALKINSNFQAIDQALTDTATTAELDARDAANRARANHTGTQTVETISNFFAAASAAAPVQSVAGKAGVVALTRADVGLSQVDNTADVDKPISTATQAALDAKLEAGAIASFETTAQLDARDTANRARANHTGTQPATTIAGLATVATSGAYADLSGRPTIPAGFTYDQQAEPINPAVGATWRERSASGLIAWEWSGSLWLSSERSVLAYSAGGASVSGTAVLTTIPKFPALLVGYSVNLVQPFAPQDSANFWEFRHIGVAGSDWLTTIGVSTVAQTHLTKTLTTPVILNVSLNGENRAVKTASAGNLRSYLVSSHYKLIRP